jgi:hypothetical protein
MTGGLKPWVSTVTLLKVLLPLRAGGWRCFELPNIEISLSILAQSFNSPMISLTSSQSPIIGQGELGIIGV